MFRFNCFALSSFCIWSEQLLELCIQGGKRETVHKGPLRVLRIGKDAGVRLEFFYIFNDVVSIQLWGMEHRLWIHACSTTLLPQAAAAGAMLQSLCGSAG